MEETLIYSDWGQLSPIEVSNFQDLTGILMELLTDEEKQRTSSEAKNCTCILLLYLTTIKTLSGKLSVLNGCILLNRYSKLLKLLSLAADELPSLENYDRQQL
jgi:hypothetical protein